MADRITSNFGATAFRVEASSDSQTMSCKSSFWIKGQLGEGMELLSWSSPSPWGFSTGGGERLSLVASTLDWLGNVDWATAELEPIAHVVRLAFSDEIRSIPQYAQASESQTDLVFLAHALKRSLTIYSP